MNQETPETPIAEAHGFTVMVPTPEGVAEAIAEVMFRHSDELERALRPFGVPLEDLVGPTWMRVVREGDVGKPPRQSLLLPPREAPAAGGAFGPGGFGGGNV